MLKTIHYTYNGPRKNKIFRKDLEKHQLQNMKIFENIITSKKFLLCRKCAIVMNLFLLFLRPILGRTYFTFCCASNEKRFCIRLTLQCNSTRHYFFIRIFYLTSSILSSFVSNNLKFNIRYP